MASKSRLDAVIPPTNYNNFLFTDVLECTNDAGGTSSGFLLVRLVAEGNVDQGFESAPELSRIRDHHVPDTDKTTKNKKGNAIFVEGNAPRKLLSVHRRLVNEMKQIIVALKSCKSKEQLDIESRKVNAMKKEYGVFRKALCDLNDTEALNQLSGHIADKYEQCINLNESLKQRYCDPAENNLPDAMDNYNDDIGPLDSASFLTTGHISVSSSKSSEVRRIEWEQKRSELRVYEELAKLRGQKAEADARAEAGVAKAEAEEAETLAKLRLEAIRIEAQEKLDECSERDSYVSRRSRMFEFWNPTVKKDESIRGSRLYGRSTTHVKLKADTKMVPSIMETKPNKNANNIKVNANNKATNELPEAHAFAAGTSTGLNPWTRRFVPQQSTNCRNDYENR